MPGPHTWPGLGEKGHPYDDDADGAGLQIIHAPSACGMHAARYTNSGKPAIS